MTKSEFLNKMKNKGLEIDPPSDFKILVTIMEEAGVKFEPEMLELPRLEVSGLSPLNTEFSQSVCTVTLPGYPHGRFLTGPEAKEVVRRCEVVNRLREHLSRYSNVETEFVIGILEGRITYPYNFPTLTI